VLEGSADLATALRNRRKISFSVLAITIVLAFSTLTIFFSKALDVLITPRIESARIDIRVVDGFAPKVFEKYLVFTSEVAFKAYQEGFESAEVVYKKNDGGTSLEIRMVALPSTVELRVDYDGDFILRIPSVDYTSSEREQVLELPEGLVEIYIEGPLLESFKKTLKISGRSISEEFVLKPTTVSTILNFKVSPEDAEVLVGNLPYSSKLGIYRIRLRKGQHTVQIRKDGYLSYSEKVRVKENESLNLGKLTLKPRPINAEFFTNPSGASVFIGDQYKGTTPFKTFLTPREKVSIKLRKRGYSQQTFDLTPKIDRDLSRRVNLAKRIFEVRVVSEPIAEVMLNGRIVGVTPLSLKTSVGDLIGAMADGYAPVEVPITGMTIDGNEYNFVLVLAGEKAFMDAPENYQLDGVEMKKIKGNLKGWKNYEISARGPIALDFFISTTEITTEAFYRYTGEEAGGSLPVTNVSWIKAVNYCNWLSEKQGLDRFYNLSTVSGVEVISFDPGSTGYRLLTKTEWLFAISDGKKGKLSTNFAWGTSIKDIPRGVGNLAGRETVNTTLKFISNYVDPFTKLSPVKSFRSSPLGIFDLSGNVREWLHNAGGVSSSYFGKDYGTGHLIAGSSFKSAQKEDLLLQNFETSSINASDVGFRLARTIR